MSLSHPSSSPSLLLSSLASSFPYAMLPLPDAMLPLSYAMLPLPYAMQPFPYALLPLPYRCSPFPTAAPLSVRAVPPSLRAVPPSLRAAPPSLRAVPPSLRAVPPSLRAAPPSLRAAPLPYALLPFPTCCSPFPTRHTRLAHTCSHHPSPPFPFLSSLPFPLCPPPSLPCLRLASPPTHPHSLQSRIRSCRSLPSRPSFPSPVLVVRPSFASLTRSVAHSPHRSNEGTVHTGQPPCIGPVAHTLTCDIHSRSTHSLLSAPLSFPMSFPPFPLLPLPPLSRVLPSVSHLVPPSTSPCLSLRSPPCSSLSLSLSPFPTFPLPPFPPFLTAPTLPSFSSLVFSVLLISALIPTPHPSPSPTHVACTYHLHLPSSHLPSSHLPLLLLSLPSVPRTSLPPSLRPSLTEPSPPWSSQVAPDLRLTKRMCSATTLLPQL
ncbi:unnamed protein product [Closterium sp. NIES-65]|nr:unnamed protein product [Closterium sp. NIES-65]